MSTRKKKLRWVIALALLALGAAGALYALLFVRKPLPSPKTFVPVGWEAARTQPMHAVHVGTKGIACNACHSENFQETPKETACASCHAREAAEAHLGSAATPTPCTTCHAFARPTKACADCHDQPQGQIQALTQHHGSTPCGACHAPHGPKGAVLAACTGCHQDVGARHGGFGVPASKEDAGTPTAEAIAALRDAGAPAGPFVTARGATIVAAEKPLVAAHAAPGEACSTCHLPHAPKAAAATSCASCHTPSKRWPAGIVAAGPPSARPGAAILAFAASAPAVEPHGPRVARHAGCTTCHAPHAATASDVTACESCHENRRAVAQVKGHAACKGCHAPHDFAPTTATCAGCHGGHAALAASQVKAHAECTSCHDPHRPERPPAAACATCHTDVHPNHPPSKDACTGCHTAHPAGGRAIAEIKGTAVPCSSCHRAAKNDQAFHGKGPASCKLCHTPHDFVRKGEGAAFCGTCHTGQRDQVSTGHADCRGCHGPPHTPERAPSCNRCHAAEASTTLRGHQACNQCHESHSGARIPRAQTCTGCHEDKGKALHGAIAGGCANCHRPHGPKGIPTPPACTSCHARERLPRLHAVPAHTARCENCHGGHVAPRMDRATCTGTCHTNRQNHQPDAAICRGCHSFKG